MSHEGLQKKQKSQPFNTAVSHSHAKAPPVPRSGVFPYGPSSPMMPYRDNTGIPGPVRVQMEAAFDTDFSNVTVHSNSSRAARLDALAYTRGHDIHFAPGTYNPGTDAGQRLLGHELAHVVQQREGRVKSTHRIRGLKANEDPGLEREADQLGDRASRFRMDGMPPGSRGAGRETAAMDGNPNHVVQGVLTRSLKSELDKCETLDDFFQVLLKYSHREQDIYEYVSQLPDGGQTLRAINEQYHDWSRGFAESGYEPGGSEEIEALAEQFSPEVEDPEDHAEEYLNEQWHDEDRPDAPEEPAYDDKDIEFNYQLKRKGNTISGPKTYKTKKSGQFTGVSYKTDTQGSIDFTSPVAKKTWKDPVLSNTYVDLGEGCKQKGYGLTKNKTKINIKNASRAQHFSIADRILAKNKVNVNRASTYTWHHLTSKYDMVLVDMTVHAKHGHNGGVLIW